jgi:hypothetical protein
VCLVGSGFALDIFTAKFFLGLRRTEQIRR